MSVTEELVGFADLVRSLLCALDDYRKTKTKGSADRLVRLEQRVRTVCDEIGQDYGTQTEHNRQRQPDLF